MDNSYASLRIGNRTEALTKEEVQYLLDTVTESLDEDYDYLSEEPGHLPTQKSIGLGLGIQGQLERGLELAKGS